MILFQLCPFEVTDGGPSPKIMGPEELI